MPQAYDFKDYQRLCHWVTRKLHAKARGRGLAVEYDDLHQELCLLWWQCSQRIDPQKAKLSTYFCRSAELAFAQGHLIARLNGKRPAGGLVSLSQPASLQADEPGGELVEQLADESAEDPEARMIRRETAAIELAGNPVMARLVELAVAPPPELAAELTALQAQRAWAAEMGVAMDSAVPTALTPTLVRQALRFNWRQRQMAMAGFGGAAA